MCLILQVVATSSAMRILAKHAQTPLTGNAAAAATAVNKAAGAALRDCVYALCQWRDTAARELDEGAALSLVQD